MEHKWEDYCDTSSECWTKLQALYAANEQYPKKVVKGRNLHHKFLRSWSKKDKEPQDNDDDNLVSLSEGDHFLAHFYIWKSANKGYRALAALAVRMMYRKSLKYITAEIAEDIAKVWESKEYTPTEETKRKIAETLKGHLVSEETRKKISETGKGRENPHTEEWNKKIAEANKGKKKSEEAIRKHAETMKGRTPWNKGLKMSEELRRKNREGHKGKKQSEETIRKRVEKLKGHSVSEETKKKIAEANKGKPSWCKGKHLSEEHRKKISDAKKRNPSGNKGMHWKLVDGKRVYSK